MTAQQPERLFTVPFVVLTASELCYFVAVGVSLFALPLYVTGPLGGDVAGAGFAYGVFAVSALVLRPFVGRLADTVGRLPFLLGGALLAAVSLGLLALADSLAAVVALRLLAGVAEAAFFVAAFAALADLAPPRRMGEALSYSSLGLYLGIAVGPVLGEVLVTGTGFAVAWLGAALLALVAAALVLLVGETRVTGVTGTDTPRIIHRPAIPIALGFLASIMAMGGFLAFAAVHGTRIGVTRPSTVLFVYGAVVVVCRIAFARAPDRLPSLPLAAASLAVMALGMGIVATWITPTGLFVGTVLLGVGVAFSAPAIFSAIFATASPTQRGTASGTASAALDLGLGLGPIALGALAGWFGIPSAFAVGAVVALLGGMWLLVLARPGAGGARTAV